jgi:hypothetical protein
MDPQVPQDAAPTAAEAGQNSVSAADPAASASDKGARTYSEAEMEGIVRDRLTRQKAQLEGAQQKQARQATEAELAEQQQFKPLAEQRAARITELETANAALTRQLLIAQHGRDLPAALQARVQGTTDDEIKADIAELRKLVAPPAAPKTEAGAGNRPGAGGPPKANSNGGGDTFAFQRPGDVRWPD